MNRRSNDCNEKALLLLYYQELDGEAEKRLRAHLGECGECRNRLQELERTLNAVPSTGVELSDIEVRKFAHRVLDQIPARRRRRSLPVLGGSLAAAAAAALIILIGLPGSPPAPGPPAKPALAARTEILQNYDMLRNLDLLENLDMLQELEASG